MNCASGDHDLDVVRLLQDELENAARAIDDAESLQHCDKVEQVRERHLLRVEHDELDEVDEVRGAHKRIHV